MDIHKLRELLDKPGSGEFNWTTEESIISMPYSETAEWEMMLEHQYFAGGPRFNGPPGIWEKLVARIEAEGRAVDLPRFIRFPQR
jgi:hypothetical protein